MDPLKNLECILLQCSLSGLQDPSMKNKTLQVCNQTNTSGKNETDTTTSNCWQYWNNNNAYKSGLILIIFVTAKKVCSVKSQFWLVKISGKKLTYPCVIFNSWTWLYCIVRDKSKIYRWGFGCLFKTENKHDLSTWPASEFFGWSSCHSGRTLSDNWPLLWALQVLNFITTIKHCTIHYFY